MDRLPSPYEIPSGDAQKDLGCLWGLVRFCNMQVGQGTSKDLVLLLLWTHLCTQAGVLGHLGFLSEARGQCLNCQVRLQSAQGPEELGAGFKFQLCLPHLGQVWLTSPRLDFHICKMGLIIPSPL